MPGPDGRAAGPRRPSNIVGMHDGLPLFQRHLAARVRNPQDFKAAIVGRKPSGRDVVAPRVDPTGLERKVAPALCVPSFRQFILRAGQGQSHAGRRQLQEGKNDSHVEGKQEQQYFRPIHDPLRRQPVGVFGRHQSGQHRRAHTGNRHARPNPQQEPGHEDKHEKQPHPWTSNAPCGERQEGDMTDEVEHKEPARRLYTATMCQRQRDESGAVDQGQCDKRSQANVWLKDQEHTHHGRGHGHRDGDHSVENSSALRQIRARKDRRPQQNLHSWPTLPPPFSARQCTRGLAAGDSPPQPRRSRL